MLKHTDQQKIIEARRQVNMKHEQLKKARVDWREAVKLLESLESNTYINPDG